MITVSSISKSFGETRALRDISFDINQGEVFGILGPNGAGKSTTINILNTLYDPDSGEVLIDGVNPKENRQYCRSIIGVVPQDIALYNDLSALDNLLFWGNLYGLKGQVLRTAATLALETVGLSHRRKDRIKTFSGGMKRRINIACSIMHRPKILLLDEPTVGIDPQSRNYIFEVIEELNNQGITVIYTSHYMEEVERLCTRLAIIDEGSIIAGGTTAELKESSRSEKIVTVKIANPGRKLMTEIRSSIDRVVPGSGNGTIEVEVDNLTLEIDEITARIRKAGGIIDSIDTRSTNLETVFLQLTGKNLRD